MNNAADLNGEQFQIAVKRTADMLRKIDEVRKQLELPVEQLPLVIETYGKVALALVAEAEREELAKRTLRLPITMRSETRDGEPQKILPGFHDQCAKLTVRPQFCAFRPEDFAIHGDRSRWVVHDIQIGNRSQFVGKRGPAAGTEFGPGGICEHLHLETCKAGMEFVMIVEYVGPEMEGEVFEATIVGLAVT